MYPKRKLIFLKDIKVQDMEREFQFFVEEECEFEGFPEPGEDRQLMVRLDKWLWAARFFKTRALARAAVEAGKVFYNGERSKPSREIELGAELFIRLGRFEKTVIVTGLSTRRRSTEEALQLFEETEQSKNYQAAEQQPLWQNNHYNNNNNNNDNNHNNYSSTYARRSYPPRLSQSPDQQPSWQNTYNDGYPPPVIPSQPYPEQRERRPTRFLRRSFTRQPTTDARPNYSGNSQQEAQRSHYDEISD